MALLDSLSAQGGAAQSTGYVPLSGGGLLQQILNQYGQQQAQDAAATGQLAGMLKQMDASGATPNVLSADGQALAQKFLAGNASRKDKLQLMGEAQTALAMQQAKAKMAADQSGANVNNAQAQLFTQQAQRMGIINQGMQQPDPGQAQQQAPAPQGIAPVQPQGPPNIPPYLRPNPQQAQAPAPNPGMLQAMSGAPPIITGQGTPITPGQPSFRAGPPPLVSIASPQVKAMYPQLLRMTGDPDKASALLQQQADAINKQNQAAYQAKVDKVGSTGNFYANGYEYKDGIPINDLYLPESVKGAGTQAESRTAGTGVLSMPHGVKPPGPVVLRSNDQPDTTAGTAGFNTKDPVWQKGVMDTQQQALSSSNNLAESHLLKDAVEAYTTGNSSRMNAIMQLPGAAALRQGLTGTNPLNALQIAMAANTHSVLDNIKSPNGSMGGRILQNEYENTAKVLGQPGMDNPSLRTAVYNLDLLNDRKNSIDQAVAKFRQIMPEGDAFAKARKMFSDPLKLQVPSAKPPANHIAYLLTHPNTAAQFEQKYTGWRASDFGVK